MWHNQYYIQPTVDRRVSLSSPFKPWGTRLIDGPSNHYATDLEDALCNLEKYLPILPSSYQSNKAIALYNHPENWLNDLSTLGPNGMYMYVVT